MGLLGTYVIQLNRMPRPLLMRSGVCTLWTGRCVDWMLSSALVLKELHNGCWMLCRPWWQARALVLHKIAASAPVR